MAGGGRSIRRVTGVLAGVMGLCVPSPAAAQAPGNLTCLKFDESTPEIYGPTDIGATLASDRLSVAVNPQGTLSVFRWPSRSYYEQLKYFTIDRDLPLLGLAPNEGAFGGLALRMADGSRRTVWLRDLRSRQRYLSDDSDTVLTRFRSRRLGLSLKLTDVVPARGAALLRHHRLELDPGSPVRTAELIAFANLNPTAGKLPLLPIEDWCTEERGTDRARYDAAADAIVYSISELDPSRLELSSVAVAIGASRRSRGHQIGADRFAGMLGAVGPTSAYIDAADGVLEGNGSLGPTEVDAALRLPLGRRPTTVVFAAGTDPAGATANLKRALRLPPARAARRKRATLRRWMRNAPLPRAAPAAVERLSRRALVSLWQAMDRDAGRDGGEVAIVASLSTQAPYFVDWIRDGAFFNEALDIAGHPRLVERHNAFYVETQKTPEEGAPPGSPLSFCGGPTPVGNWFMTNYADGGDAGTFTWEIDETGLGLWTLWRHYRYLSGGRARAYLERVYPAIQRTAEFLVAFRDPLTKLPPGTACEDDNPPRSGQPTMHSAGPVLLAMRSAERAARALGRAADAARYAIRRRELEAAIDQHYGSGSGPWTSDFGDGGWALWPVRVKPYRHPRSAAQGELVWRRVKPAFLAPNGPKLRGQYEIKALHGLAHLYRATAPQRMRRVTRGLRWIADVQAGYQRTGILGEAWYVRDGRVISVVSQPHVWEQTLFYLTALKAYGREAFTTAGPR